MGHAGFLRLVLAYALTLAAAALAANVTVDAFEVLGTGMFKHVGQPEERFLKVEALRSRPGFNTVILGSSRAGVIRTEDVDAAIPGARSYNLSVSQANQWDNEQLVRWLIDRYPGIVRVIIQVDWPSTYGETKPGYTLMTAMHPDVTGRTRAGFALDYVTYFSPEAMLDKVSNNLGNRNRLEYDFAKGYWARPTLDRMSDADCASYVRAESRFRPLPKVPTDRDVMRRNLEALHRIAQALAARGIVLDVVLTAHNHGFLDAIDIRDYEYFLRETARMGPVLNMMFYSPLTNDDCNYYEINHFRPSIGARVADSIAERPGGDFVRWVSAANIDEEVGFIRRNFEIHRRRLR